MADDKIPVLPAEISSHFLDGIEDGIFGLDESGVIRYANQGLARILSHSSGTNIVGLNFSAFIHSGDLARVREIFGRIILEGIQDPQMIPKIRLGEGFTTWISVIPQGRFVLDGTMLHFGIVRDISQLKKTEQALTMTERFYRSVVDLSPDVIAVIDPTGRILQVNSKGIELFGIRSSIMAGESSFQEPEEFGSSILDAVAPEFKARLVEDISTILLYGSIDDSEYRIQGPDGNLFWGSMSARLIPSAEDETSTILLSIRNITRRKDEETHLEHLATMDALTGIFNRRGFTVAAEQEILHASRRREGMALIFMDLDGLKSINDRFGHSEGDRALCSTAEILRSTFRKSDILGRWGGDEFVALALDVPQGSISLLLNRLEKARREANAGSGESGRNYELSFSLGMTVFDPTSPQSLEFLIAEADAHMYRAKQERKRRSQP